MSASIKLHHLESKISDLQKQHQLLLKEREKEIASLISSVDLAHLDDKTLAGGMLFLKEKITTQDSITEAWHVSGEKFLRYHKPKSQRHLQHDVEKKRESNGFQFSKQTNVRFQSSPKKTTSPKPNPVPQAADQLPQEYP